MKRRILALLSALSLLLLAGCGKSRTPEPVSDETPTVSQEPTVEAPTWETIYTEFLTNSDAEAYLLYDVYGDSNPELFLQTGNSEANYEFELYTIAEAEMKLLGTFPGGHLSICATDQPNSFLTYSGFMGDEYVSLYSIEGNQLSKKPIYFCRSVYVSEYLDLSTIPLQYLFSFESLQWDDSPAVVCVDQVMQMQLEEADAAYEMLGEENYVYLSSVASAMVNTSTHVGGISHIDSSSYEDRLHFLIFELMDSDSPMPDRPQIQITDNSFTISLADLNKMEQYFFGTTLTYEENSSWDLNHNAHVTYANSTFTVKLPEGNMNLGRLVCAVSNFIHNSDGSYTATVAAFSTDPYSDMQIDYTMNFSELSQNPAYGYSPYEVCTLTVTEANGQYLVENFHSIYAF